MVSGKDLLTEPQQEEYEERKLGQHKSDEIHDKLDYLAKNWVEEDFEKIDTLTWQQLAKKEANLIWRNDPSFKRRCENDFNLDPYELPAIELSEIVALKQAENGE